MIGLNFKNQFKSIFGQSEKDNVGMNGEQETGILDAFVGRIANSNQEEQDLTTSFKILNEMELTLKLEQDSILLAIFSGEFNGVSSSKAEIALYVDNVQQSDTKRIAGDNTTVFVLGTQGVFNLKAGTHKVSIKGKLNSGSIGDIVSGDNGELNIITFKKQK